MFFEGSGRMCRAHRAFCAPHIYTVYTLFPPLSTILEHASYRQTRNPSIGQSGGTGGRDGGKHLLRALEGREGKSTFVFT